MKQTTLTSQKEKNPKAEEAAAIHFLQSSKQSFKATLYSSIGLSMLDGVLLVAQAWMVASILHQLVFHGGEIGEYSTYLYTLPFVFMLRALLNWFAKQHLFRATEQLKQRLRHELIQKISSNGPLYVGNHGTGKLAHIIGDGIEALGQYFSSYLPAKHIMVLLPLVIMIAVAPFDRVSMAVMLITAPLIPFFMILISKHTQEKNQSQWQRMARMSGYFLDRLQGVVTLKLFGASKREADAIERISDAYRRDTIAVLRVAFLSSLVLEFLATLSIAMIAVFIGFRLLWGEMELLHGLFILLLAPEFYLPLRQMGTQYHAKMDAVAAAEQIAAAWEENTPANAPSRNAEAKHTLPTIRLEDVCLEYPDEKGQLRTALNGLTLDVASGETLALIGPSGGGKSSILNLVLGFAHASSGEIAINDTPLSQLPIELWRKQIAWMPQQPHVFHGTIAENITLAKADATLDEIRTAARSAFIDNEIMSLPHGYDTHIGERGTGLSGGQIRRIALARAFLRNASLILLDEPTASLDRKSEQLVMQSLETLCQNRTVIMVAHRLEILGIADRVVRIQDGKNAGDVTGISPQNWEVLCN